MCCTRCAASAKKKQNKMRCFVARGCQRLCRSMSHASQYVCTHRGNDNPVQSRTNNTPRHPQDPQERLLQHVCKSQRLNWPLKVARAAARTYVCQNQRPGRSKRQFCVASRRRAPIDCYVGSRKICFECFAEWREYLDSREIWPTTRDLMDAAQT